MEGNHSANVKYILAITAPTVSLIGNTQNTRVKILKNCNECDLYLAFSSNTAITMQKLRITDSTADICTVYTDEVTIETCTFQYGNVEISQATKMMLDNCTFTDDRSAWY